MLTKNNLKRSLPAISNSINNKYLKNKKRSSKGEEGIFLILLGILLAVLIGFLALSVDLYVLFQSHSDMKVAAQMMADGAIRYITDDKTWLPHEDGQDPYTNMPMSEGEIKTKMSKLAEEIFILGNKKNNNLSENTVTLEFGTLDLANNNSETNFDNSVSIPTSYNARQTYPITGNRNVYYAVRVTVETGNGDSRIAGIFSKFYGFEEFEISATGIAYYNIDATGVSRYAFEH